jgi:hypothetical protein
MIVLEVFILPEKDPASMRVSLFCGFPTGARYQEKVYITAHDDVYFHIEFGADNNRMAEPFLRPIK